MPDPNPILDANNERVQVTNLYGGTEFPQGRDSFHGLPLGTADDTGTGEILVKCKLIGAISVSATTEATATAAAPSYAEGTAQAISQNLTGDLRTIAKIASGQTLGLVASSAIIGNVRIDQTTPGTTNGVAIASALPAGSNIIGNFRIDQTTPGTTNKVSIGTDGTVAVNAALPAGSNIIGNFRVDQTTPGTTNGVQLTGSQLTPASELDTDGGTVTAGKKQIDFIFSTTYTGNVNGIAYSGATDSVMSFVAPAGYTLAAITWTTTAGSVRVVSY